MTPDKPWIFRTYAGYATPRQTNERFRANLAKGQTGLSIAFDLPTQCGYDADHPMSRGEVGRVGVPVGHLGDMRALLEGIPLAEMNTSMTINATAVWLLALYVAVAEEQGADPSALSGTTQNDILKEYLSRGTYAFPPGPSMRLTADLVTWTLREVQRWNPINVCSYHLQEAGADPVLEAAFTMSNAIAVVDAVRATGRVVDEDVPRLVGRMSFFLNAGIRFVEEMCKVRAMARLWDRICRERYGVEDQALRRFRYGVQVNSLGLTAEQPENNAYRIFLEMLAVALSKDARARAVQLPAWNEALGLPRSWDQQWSLRAQQILAYESDLLEHDDLFRGSTVVEGLGEGFAFHEVDPEAEVEQIEGLARWRRDRDEPTVRRALDALRTEAEGGGELVDVSIEAARAGVTTGEWAGALREVFGDYRAPTGVSARTRGGSEADLSVARARVAEAASRAGVQRLRMLVGKPGLDGHSNAAELIAVRARDAGFEVIYQGIRLTPEQIARAAAEEDAHVIGLSVLSGAHSILVPDVLDRLREQGVDPAKVPVVVGGIIPDEDATKLKDLGAAAVYTPLDHDLTSIVAGIADLISPGT